LYVGNLAHGITEKDLTNLFSPHGTVQSAQVFLDRQTGRSRGFGSVAMASGEQAQAALQAMHGQEVHGRPLTVSVARPREGRGGSPRGLIGGSVRGVFCGTTSR
jgi:RNA recognition motif-containing protein